MEGISPTLNLVMSIRQNLETGESTRNAIRFYLLKNNDEVSRALSIWLSQNERGQTQCESAKLLLNTRKLIFELISRGLSGEPILQQLISLEEELFESAKIDLENFAALLPVKVLVPLLLLQFPALLVLLFGPLLRQMLLAL